MRKKKKQTSSADKIFKRLETWKKQNSQFLDGKYVDIKNENAYKSFLKYLRDDSTLSWPEIREALSSFSMYENKFIEVFTGYVTWIGTLFAGDKLSSLSTQPLLIKTCIYVISPLFLWVAKQFLFKLSIVLAQSERQFVLEVLQQYKNLYEEIWVEIQNGDIICVPKSTIMLYPKNTSDSRFCSYAYKIVVKAQRNFEYCMLSKHAYDISKNSIKHDFVRFAKRINHDWQNINFNSIQVSNWKGDS